MSVSTEVWPYKKNSGLTVTESYPLTEKTVFNIDISPNEVFKGLLLFIGFLLFCNLVAIVFRLNFDHADPHRLTRLFIFDAETNIPTFFSSLTLFFCAGLLTFIAAAQKRLRASGLPWFGLAAIFLFLSIDEAASLHEKLTVPFREFFDSSGFLYFAWVIPYGLALTLFCLLYFRFLSELPRKIMILTLVSGLTYISGAMGFEMISGVWAEGHGNKDLIYSLIVTCEELLEMLGSTIFIYTLLLYVTERFDKLTITAIENIPVDQSILEETPVTSHSAGFPAQSYMRSQAIETVPRGEQGVTEISGRALREYRETN